MDEEERGSVKPGETWSTSLTGIALGGITLRFA